jgi:rare lipoprotein A (peptidoglycan hydrolase)
MWTRTRPVDRCLIRLSLLVATATLAACSGVLPPQLVRPAEPSMPERQMATDGQAVRPAPLAEADTAQTAPTRPPGPPRIPRKPAAPGGTFTPYDGPDGPHPNPPPLLGQIPDAVPRIEFIRDGAPNKPYVARGESHVPLKADAPLRQVGLASWYGRKFHGRRTAGGEVYDMHAMTAAHPTLPIPSYARVHNPANGRTVVVRINDRGPFRYGRIIDLSYTAAHKLGFAKGKGTARVVVERITPEDIRTGSWRDKDRSPS